VLPGVPLSWEALLTGVIRSTSERRIRLYGPQLRAVYWFAEKQVARRQRAPLSV
jgi:hypothetical protein